MHVFGSVCWMRLWDEKKERVLLSRNLEWNEQERATKRTVEAAPAAPAQHTLLLDPAPVVAEPRVDGRMLEAQRSVQARVSSAVARAREILM